MKYYAVTIASLLLLLVGLVLSEPDPPDIMIRDFSGGLNTMTSPFAMQSNQAGKLLNVDLSNKLGALSKRRGYVAMTDALAGDSSLNSIYGFTSLTGGKNLYGVVNIDSVGAIYVSDNYEYSLASGDGASALCPSSKGHLYKNYIYTGTTGRWISWRGDVIFFNGRQEPIYIDDGTEARQLIPTAPGAPTVIPLNLTPPADTFGLNGEYIYALSIIPIMNDTVPDSWRDTANSDSMFLGPLSRRVYADDKKVMVKGWAWIGADWTTDTTGSNGYDSAIVGIYRTRANPAEIDFTDTLWRVKLFSANTMAKLADSIFIDSIPDDSLGAGSYAAYRLFERNEAYFNDTTDYNYARIGMPWVYGIDSTGLRVLPDSTTSDSLCVGFAYMMTIRDTLTQAESDSSRSLLVYFQMARDCHYYISIPILPVKQRGAYERCLYRANIIERANKGQGSISIEFDTTFTDVCVEWRGPKWVQECVEWTVDTIIQRVVSYDTSDAGLTASIEPYRLVAIISDSTQEVVRDTVLYDASYSGFESFGQKYYDISGLRGLTVWDGRVWGYKGDTVRWSQTGVTAPFQWLPLQYYILNLGDDDEVTALMPMRDYLKVFKNKSQFIIIPNSAWTGSLYDPAYIMDWTISNLGCVAPRSLVNYRDGLIYLSNEGVVYEIGSQSHARIGNYQQLSLPIDDLLRYPSDDVADARGAVKNNKYFLSFPAKDTTYVYDFIAQGWSIYDYAFTASTYYDTITSGSMTPTKDLLFITGESDLVYKADTTTTDAGDNINIDYLSPPIAVSSNAYQINKMGLWLDGYDEDTTISVYIQDMNDNKIYTRRIKEYNDRFHVFGPSVLNSSNYFSIGITDDNELTSDGGLNNSAAWTVFETDSVCSNEWSIDGKARLSACNHSCYIIIDGGFDDGDSVKLMYDIVYDSSAPHEAFVYSWMLPTGGGTLVYGDTVQSDSIDHTDVFEISTASSNQDIYIGLYVNADAHVKIDNFRVSCSTGCAVSSVDYEFTFAHHWDAFTSSGPWSWNITGQNVEKTPASGYVYLDQDVDVISGEAYKLVYKIDTFSRGILWPYVGNARETVWTYSDGTGTLTDSIIAGNGGLRLRASPGSELVIDSVSVTRYGSSASTDSLTVYGIDVWIENMINNLIE